MWQKSSKLWENTHFPLSTGYESRVWRDSGSSSHIVVRRSLSWGLTEVSHESSAARGTSRVRTVLLWSQLKRQQLLKDQQSGMARRSAAMKLVCRQGLPSPGSEFWNTKNVFGSMSAWIWREGGGEREGEGKVPEKLCKSEYHRETSDDCGELHCRRQKTAVMTPAGSSWYCSPPHWSLHLDSYMELNIKIFFIL